MQKALERIRKELVDSGRDSRYRISAYGFVLNGLEYYISRIGTKRHVSGEELSYGLAEFAARQFGPLAHDVLCAWGIEKTDDFGAIVYNLIGIGLMSRRDEDRLEDFFSVFNLKAYLDAYPEQKLDLNFIRAVRGA